VKNNRITESNSGEGFMSVRKFKDGDYEDPPSNRGYFTLFDGDEELKYENADDLEYAERVEKRHRRARADIKIDEDSKPLHNKKKEVK
jgi:hypothetical protein